MSATQPNEPGSYELPLHPSPASPAPGTVARPAESFPGSIALENAQWYCRLRWFAVLVVAIGGAVALFGWAGGPPVLGPWVLVLAGVLAAGNAAFLIHIRRHGSPNRASLSLWSLRGQVCLDLSVITAGAFLVGPRQTAVAFSYLLCIVLGCVFFTRRQSLGLALIAGGIYGACVTAERLDLLRPVVPAVEGAPGPAGVAQAIPTVAMWLTIWYLVSYLSSMGRRRGIELARANRRLLAVQKERQRHMLTTTHQLKAPLAAIHANTQVLLGGYCGTLPEPAMQVVGRIAARSRRLAAEIQEMLELANLSSPQQQAPATDVDLPAVLDWCLEQLEPLAARQEVTFHKDLRAACARGVEEHFKTMFLNLLSNAVNYSYRGGTVSLTCGPGPHGAAVVTIRDEGIGIELDKLPRIFDEYYRTSEAVRHNRESSGLGLAIVRHVAELHRVRVLVHSAPGRGATFELHFPSGVARVDGT